MKVSSFSLAARANTFRGLMAGAAAFAASCAIIAAVPEGIVGPALAQNAGAANISGPAAVEPVWKTPVVPEMLDSAAFAQWVSGQETPFTGPEGKPAPVPGDVIWNGPVSNLRGSLRFGDNKEAGQRHMRIGFTRPVNVGSVLVRGGGSLSVLRPDAPYPGALDDDSLWIPAERLDQGKVTRDEVAPTGFALWTLPPGTSTRALRFSHNANATDNGYAGQLSGVFVFTDRLTDLASAATVVTSAESHKATRLVNGKDEGWGTWDNGPKPDAPVVSPEHPEWIMLFWPKAVPLDGALTLVTAFGAAQVQVYTGPENRHPREALEGDWKTVSAYRSLKLNYPNMLVPNRLDIGTQTTTRALRLLITAPAKKAHPHIDNKIQEGRRIWLGELMALRNLGTAPLKNLDLSLPAANRPNPPIPVRFKLAEPGYVTLVIENESGMRVRNLVSETYFPAGDNVAWWDGTDDLGRDVDAARHGLYRIPAQFVSPGKYQVRGLVRPELGLFYEFGVYTGGNPPWATPDGTGAWLSNHTPPQAALYVPADNSPGGKAAVLLGSYVSEGRDGVAWVDLEGKKLGGKKWVGGTWTGAPYMARDIGTQPAGPAYAYVAAGWEGALRLTALLRDAPEKSVLAQPYNFPGTTPEEKKANSKVGGIAVRDGLIVVSLPAQDKLLLVDAKSGSIRGEIALKTPRGIAWDTAGKLFALSGNTLVAYDAVPANGMGATAKTLIGTGLEDPRGITLDPRGNIYISDRGNSHQVKVFDARGKLLRAIGKPGKPVAGPYDPLHMNNPDGLTVDERGRLWVTENDYLPKRVSLWSPEGQLLRAFYGPGKYGGGGTIDEMDKNRFYYADEGKGTMEFALDWEKGSFQLTSVLYRKTEGAQPLAFRAAAPERALYHQGKRYFTNCYNSSPTNGHSTAYLFAERGGVLQPVAAAGRATDWEVLSGPAFEPLFAAATPAEAPGAPRPNRNSRIKPPFFFLWTDNNGDATVQPEEVKLQSGTSGGVTILPDLSFCVSRVNGQALRFAPTGVLPGGVPQYDFASPQVVATDVEPPASSGGDQLLVGEGGRAIITLGVKPFSRLSLSGTQNGKASWSYPSLWPGLHASHNAARPEQPGEVIGSTRLLGGFINPKGSEVGQIFGVNGNMGNMYLFTSDGLFVGTLFEDVRQGQLWKMPVSQRNTKLENISLHDENFWPSLNQTPDGRVYLVDGANTCIVRVDGLDKIRRIPAQQLTVTPDLLKASQEYLVNQEALRQRNEGSGVLLVASPPSAPVVDGNLEEWAKAEWADIDRRGAGANFNSSAKPYDIAVSLAVSGDRLYAAFRTGDEKLLLNSGEAPQTLFKTGGALDLMLGTDPKADPARKNPVAGDIRLLVTQVKGKTTAVLYRAVVPGTKTPVPFSSPWRTITLDRVDDVSAEVQLAGKGGNYEFSIPLAVLGLKVTPGMRLSGDAGVLRGDGTQTTARVYWANKATGITADVPSEAMLTPGLWGHIEFR